MSRNIAFSKGEFYHLYNRGVDRRTVFENDSDYKRFILLLYLCNYKTAVRFDFLPDWKSLTSLELIKAVFENERGSPLVAIGAYCLLPNHFHILVREISEGGISAFMQKLITAYTMYFNSSRGRTGALFQGRFKAQHAYTDVYLKYLFSYIHLNPVKIFEPKWKEQGIGNVKKAEQFLETYSYSSFFDYIGLKREFAKIIDRKQFPEYFSSKQSFQKCLRDWLTYKDILMIANQTERLNL